MPQVKRETALERKIRLATVIHEAEAIVAYEHRQWKNAQRWRRAQARPIIGRLRNWYDDLCAWLKRSFT